jgi:hypothetical protein
MRLPFRSSPAILLALAAGAFACANAGSDLGFVSSSTARVIVGVYLDRDGSRTFTPPPVDTVFIGARVALLTAGTRDTVRTLITGAGGLATFDAVPVGEYTIAVTQASIGDSIQVAAIDSANVRVTATGGDQSVLVRLGYPEVTIRTVRTLPLGKRAFIRGVILAGVQSFRDTTSHVADSSGQIRLTRVILRGGLTGNAPGDSVSVLGTVSTRAGQPTLDLALVAKIGSRPAPVPFSLSTAAAGTASGGSLDAALVQVIGAIVSDSATVAPDFQVTASEGSGPLKIILDATLPFARTAFRPGRSLNVTGVLVPDGQGGWTLKPRTTGDVVFNN